MLIRFEKAAQTKRIKQPGGAYEGMSRKGVGWEGNKPFLGHKPIIKLLVSISRVAFVVDVDKAAGNQAGNQAGIQACLQVRKSNPDQTRNPHRRTLRLLLL